MTKTKLEIEKVLENKELMDYFVGFHRDEWKKMNGLFAKKQLIEREELKEETAGGDYIDFHPFFSHIAPGEYGNCVLTLYREKFYDSYLKNPSLYEEHPEVKKELIENRHMVFGVYSYQYKGDIEEEWFTGELAEFVEVEMK